MRLKEGSDWLNGHTFQAINRRCDRKCVYQIQREQINFLHRGTQPLRKLRGGGGWARAMGTTCSSKNHFWHWRFRLIISISTFLPLQLLEEEGDIMRPNSGLTAATAAAWMWTYYMCLCSCRVRPSNFALLSFKQNAANPRVCGARHRSHTCAHIRFHATRALIVWTVTVFMACSEKQPTLWGGFVFSKRNKNGFI